MLSPRHLGKDIRIRMADQYHEVHEAEHIEPPISISHLLHMLRAYFPAMFLGLLAVVVGYLIVAAAVFLLMPSQRITSLPFRLDFEGATKGEYPNGTKFSTAEIVSTPILLTVYRNNQLERYTKLTDFTRSVFVLETNAAAEALANDYQARLADPRLTPLDRDRIQREYEMKRASLSKNEYSINYLRPSTNGAVPEPIVRKVLAEILRAWAGFAVNEQRVLSYPVTVLSPSVVAPTSFDRDPIAATHILRSKTIRLLDNARAIAELPGADLARAKNQMSLADVGLRLEEIVRFRLEPLLPHVSAVNPAAARQFLTVQLAYDQRELLAQQNRVNSIQAALDLYTQTQRTPEAPAAGTQKPPAASGSENSMVMTDAFLDRLVALTTNANDITYRQRLTEMYRAQVQALVPLQRAVNYDEEALHQTTTNSGTRESAADVQQELEATRSEIRQLVLTMNEIYTSVSRNLNPSTALYSASAPFTRVQRSVNLRRLAMAGVLIVLLSLPILVLLAFLHHRVQRENAEVAETA